MAKQTMVQKGLGKATKLAINDDGSLNPRAQSALSAAVGAAARRADLCAFVAQAESGCHP